VIERLGIKHADELQRLLERCSDYYETCEHRPTPADAAYAEFAPPPGRVLDDLFVFGLRSAAGELIGVNCIVRHWPKKPEEWWLSGQIIDPAHRNHGVGTAFYRDVEAFVVAQGGRVIQAAVVERNTAAERFWRRIGFREIERQDYVAPSGWPTRIIMMRRDVPADATSITIAQPS
jgi:ribosomal protein S18 acetylase RimI-like enzyme